MSTTKARVTGAGVVRAAAASRAVLCGVLAIVVTFSQDAGKANTSADRDPAFGLAVLGVFLLLQAALLLGFTRSLAGGLPGRLVLGLRAVISGVGGVVALTNLGGGLAVLVPLEAVVFLLVGALEIVGGVRRTEAVAPGDAVVVGGLQVLVGFLLVVLDRQALFTIGVLGAWGAIVAVYLGIAAASTGRKRVAA